MPSQDAGEWSAYGSCHPVIFRVDLADRLGSCCPSPSSSLRVHPPKAMSLVEMACMAFLKEGCLDSSICLLGVPTTWRFLCGAYDLGVILKDRTPGSILNTTSLLVPPFCPRNWSLHLSPSVMLKVVYVAKWSEYLRIKSREGAGWDQGGWFCMEYTNNLQD